MLIGCFSGAAWLFAQDLGILSVCYAWVVGYPILIVVLCRLSTQVVPLSLFAYLRNLAAPLCGILSAGVATWGAKMAVSTMNLPALSLVTMIVASLAATAAYSKWVLGVSLKDLVPQAEDEQTES